MNNEKSYIEDMIFTLTMRRESIEKQIAYKRGQIDEITNSISDLKSRLNKVKKENEDE